MENKRTLTTEKLLYTTVILVVVLATLIAGGGSILFELETAHNGGDDNCKPADIQYADEYKAHCVADELQGNVTFVVDYVDGKIVDIEVQPPTGSTEKISTIHAELLAKSDGSKYEVNE